MRLSVAALENVRPLWIVVAFVVVRVVHVSEVVESPALVQHHWPTTDMATFDRWADDIRSGDVASRAPPWVLNQFQRDVAVRFLAAHPDALGDDAARLGSANDDAAAVALWERWFGAPRFYQEPMFPYALAVWRSVFGANDLGGLVFETLCGALALVLMMRVVERAHGRTAALAAGALTTLCAPLCFAESLLLRETLTTAICWLALDRFYAARTSPSIARVIVAGVAAGAAIVARTTTAPLAVALVLVLAFDARASRANVVKTALAFVAGVSIALAPIVVRNVFVDAPPWSIVGGGGAIAFAAANAAGSDPWRGLVLDAPLFARLLDEHGTGPALAAAALSTHAGVGALIAFELDKLAAFFHACEIPDNASFALYRAHAFVLHLLPVDFGVALPLACVGAVVALRARRGRALVAFALTTALLPLLLQPVSRYRTTLLAACLALAGIAVAEALRAWSSSSRARVVVALVACVVVALAMHRPLPEGVFTTRFADHAAAWRYWTEPALQSARTPQEAADALRLYLRGASLAEGRPQIEALYANARAQLASIEAGDEARGPR